MQQAYRWCLTSRVIHVAHVLRHAPVNSLQNNEHADLTHHRSVCDDHRDKQA